MLRVLHLFGQSSAFKKKQNVTEHFWGLSVKTLEEIKRMDII